MLITNNAVDLFEKLLSHDHAAIIEDVLWLISNLVTNCQKAKIVFTTSKIFNKIKFLIENSKSIKLMKILTQLASNILYQNKPKLSENIVFYF